MRIAGRLGCFALIAGWCLLTSSAACAVEDLEATTADQHFERGRQAYEAGDYERARQEFERAVQSVAPGTVLEAEPMTASPPAMSSAPAAPVELKVPALRWEEETERVTYLIGVNDVVAVSVWQVPDLTRDVTVRPDGKISYPLIGDIPAEGLTLTELDHLLTERLRAYVREPQVTVELRRMREQRVAVLGEVAQQGVYRIAGKTTVPEVIAMAQGFRPTGARIRDVVIVKGYPDQPRVVHLNVNSLLRRGKAAPVTVDGGDIIYVSRTWVADANAALAALAPALNTTLQVLSGFTTHEVYLDIRK